ncbi:MAG: LPS export ABC transporter periplasmic protein LptC [Cyanobacteria bacterium P01_G01_bin.38]
MTKWYKLTVIAAVVGVIGVAIYTWQASRQTLESINTPEEVEAQEPGLTLQNVTLEQPDENGNLLWKVKAKEVTYSPDQQIADIKAVEGEFYQDDRPIYKVKGDRGNIDQAGREFVLEGNVVATGIDSKVTLKGEKLEWRPKEDLLLVEDSINGDHPQLKASAQKARLYNKAQRLELEGGVVGTTTQAPWFGLQATAITWHLEQERIETKQGLKVEQFKSQDDKTVTDRVTGNQGEVKLDQKTVRLQENVKLELLEQEPVVTTSSVALWNLEAETVAINAPVRVQQPKQQLTVTAAQAQMDLKQQLINFMGNVRAIAAKDSSQLTADRLSWQIESQDVAANGNVTYRQQNPATVVTGQRANGNLDRQTVVVSGGDVITEITP